MWLVAISYILLQSHSPIQVSYGSVHDDGLFIRIGENLAGGKWLGKFDSLTLAKGPGYPIFLAISSWSGLSISMSQAIFQSLASMLAVKCASRVIRNQGLLCALYFFLLFNPASFSSEMRRILREDIYSVQVIIILFLASLALRAATPLRTRILASIVSGLTLGWFWITREEGFWLLPSLFVLIAVSFLLESGRRPAFIVALLLTGFSIPPLFVRCLNYVAYGSFCVVDFNEREFNRMLSDLMSIRVGEPVPLLGMRRDARMLAYEVSPSFRRLRDYLEGQPGKNWAQHSCPHLPSAYCNEIGSGHFVWALRDGMAAIGEYRSPAQAKAFASKVADEVELACSKQEVPCKQSLWGAYAQIEGVKAAYIVQRSETLLRLFFPWRGLPTDVGETEADGHGAQQALDFLNRPRILRVKAGSDKVEIFGWYYSQGDEWFWVSGGESAQGLRLTRQPSPDIAMTFSDDKAIRQRFKLDVDCFRECSEIMFATYSGYNVSVPIKNAKAGEISVGQSKLFIDGIVHKKLKDNYFLKRLRVSFVVILCIATCILGLVTVPALLQQCIFCGLSVCLEYDFMLSLACLIAVASRYCVLLIVDVTVFPTTYINYVAPAYYLMSSAGILALCGFFRDKKAWNV